jgi:hypothetical protein
VNEVVLGVCFGTGGRLEVCRALVFWRYGGFGHVLWSKTGVYIWHESVEHECVKEAL